MTAEDLMGMHYRCQHCRWPTSERSGLIDHLVAEHGIDREDATRAAADVSRRWDDAASPEPTPASTLPSTQRERLWDGAELHARLLRLLALLTLVSGILGFVAIALANRDPAADPPVDLAVGGYALAAAVVVWAVLKACALLLELLLDRTRNG